MEKRDVWRLTVMILLLLLVCTILSAWVYETGLPQVVAYSPESGIVNGVEYRMLVPVSCVEQDNEGTYVFRLKQVDGQWKAERASVTVEDSDGIYTAIRRATADQILVAAFPSRQLQDGEKVKVIP